LRLKALRQKPLTAKNAKEIRKGRKEERCGKYFRF
jgi:hypothetical protein